MDLRDCCLSLSLRAAMVEYGALALCIETRGEAIPSNQMFASYVIRDCLTLRFDCVRLSARSAQRGGTRNDDSSLSTEIHRSCQIDLNT